MRVIVIGSDGKVHEAKADVVIVADEATNVPVAMSRTVSGQIEFLTIEQLDEFVKTLRQVVGSDTLGQLFTLPTGVFELTHDEKIRKVT